PGRFHGATFHRPTRTGAPKKNPRGGPAAPIPAGPPHKRSAPRKKRSADAALPFRAHARHWFALGSTPSVRPPKAENTSRFRGRKRRTVSTRKTSGRQRTAQARHAHNSGW